MAASQPMAVSPPSRAGGMASGGSDSARSTSTHLPRYQKTRSASRRCRGWPGRMCDIGPVSAVRRGCRSFVHRLQRAQIDIQPDRAARPSPRMSSASNSSQQGRCSGYRRDSRNSCQHLAQPHGAAHLAAKDREPGLRASGKAVGPETRELDPGHRRDIGAKRSPSGGRVG